MIVLVLVYTSPAVATTRSECRLDLALLENDYRHVQLGYWLKPRVSSLKERIEKFLVRYQVRYPAYYAEILDKEKMSDAERKLFAAILVPETRGRINAVSSEGAVGPWQQHPCWFKRYGKARDPRRNLQVCLDIYRIHRKEEKTSDKALLAYSGGSQWYPKKIRRLVAEI